MNELSTEFDWRIGNRISLGEDSPATPIPRFDDLHSQASAREFQSCSHSGNTGPHDNDIGLLLHDIIVDDCQAVRATHIKEVCQAGLLPGVLRLL
jgi:hypothetical protein